jgi:FdhD protein
MLTHQPLRSQTGATHAAAWADPGGSLERVREDLGRHNALDKLMGSLLRDYGRLPAGFCVISSRASFEMVQKAASVGVTSLVALSAATSMAVDAAHDLGVMLAGFARDDQFTVYSHPEYLAGQGGLHE